MWWISWPGGDRQGPEGARGLGRRDEGGLLGLQGGQTGQDHQRHLAPVGSVGAKETGREAGVRKGLQPCRSSG